MLQDSKDLLYLAISLAVILVAGGLTYLLIKAGKTVGQAEETVKDVNRKLAKFDTAVDEAAPAVAELAHTVRLVNQKITNLGGMVRNVSRFINVMRNKEE